MCPKLKDGGSLSYSCRYLSNSFHQPLPQHTSTQVTGLVCPSRAFCSFKVKSEFVTSSPVVFVVFQMWEPVLCTAMLDCSIHKVCRQEGFLFGGLGYGFSVYLVSPPTPLLPFHPWTGFITKGRGRLSPNTNSSVWGDWVFPPEDIGSLVIL